MYKVIYVSILISVIVYLLFLRCVPVIDLNYKDTLIDRCWFTFNGSIRIIGGYYSQSLYYQFEWDLLHGFSRDYTARRIQNYSVYEVSDSNYDVGDFIDLKDVKLQKIPGKIKHKEVFRDHYSYVEFNGAVYCIGGETPWSIDKSIKYGDVWKSTDGIHWKQILEKGPWTEDGEFYYDHTVRILDDGRGPRIWLVGGRNEKRHLSTLWSSTDGINWIKEHAFSDMEEINQFFEFNHALYIRGNKYNYPRTWKKDYGDSNQFVKIQDPLGNSPYNKPGILIFNDKLWYAADGLYSSKDGLSWIELFHSKNFYDRLTTDGDKLTLILPPDIKYTSSDGYIWNRESTGIIYDFNPDIQHPENFNNDEYDLNVLQFKNELWLFTGHPDRIWKSSDGITWEKVPLSVECTIFPRIKFGVTVFNNRIWILGGEQQKVIATQEGKAYERGNMVLKDIWSSDDGVHWRREPDPAWFSRSSAVAFVHKNKLYLSGGTATQYEYPAIWESCNGKSWKLLCNYPELGRDECVPPNQQKTFIFNGKIRLLHRWGDQPVYTLNNDTSWNARSVPKNLTFKNVIVIKQLDNTDVACTIKDDSLFVSEDLQTWKGVSCHCELSHVNISQNNNSTLARYQNRLIIVNCDVDSVTSSFLVLDD